MKLFARDDDEYAARAADSSASAIRARPVSRLNEQAAQLRAVNVELDQIEQQIAQIRERQASALLRALMPKPRPGPRAGTVESVDLRTLVDVDLTHGQLDAVSNEIDPTDDFDKRFAAFARVEDEDLSRRWLDTD